MRKSPRTPALLQTRGFSLHGYLGRKLHVGFFAQCCIVAGLVAVLMLTASTIDHSLILPGRDIGLLQHPGLWGFPLLQIVLSRVHSRDIIKTAKSTFAVGRDKEGFSEASTPECERYQKVLGVA